MQLRAPDRLTGGDDGFSLVEAIVALAIATAVFTALAFALIGGAKSSLLSQQNQQAGDVLNKAVESARALPYQTLAMQPADLDAGEVSGPSRAPVLSVGSYNPGDDTTTGTLEPLVTDLHGALAPHVTQETQNGGTFTIRRYVTVPADASGAVYKRLTVVVTWNGLGKERKRTYSTLVAESKRGLPLPDFKLTGTASLSQCRNPGSVAVYGFNIKNNGARDAWSLTTAPTTPTWSFFEDVNANGTYDSTTDVALPTTSAGVPSTGLIEPTQARRFLGVLQLADAATQPAPYTLTTLFRATSVAQPSYFQQLTAVTTVQADACGAVATSPSPAPSPTSAPPPAPGQPEPSCASLTGPAATSAPGGTLVRYYPYNPTQPGNTAASAPMPVLRDAGSPPASGNLYNYSTDLHAVAGRKLTAANTTGLPDLATWTYGMPARSVLKGNGEVTVWAQPSDGSLTAAPAFRIRLDILDGSNAVVAAIGSFSYATPSTGWQCTGMRPFSVQIPDIYPGSGLAIEANNRIRVRVDITNGIPVRLGYGTAAYPMTVTLPYKSGLG